MLRHHIYRGAVIAALSILLAACGAGSSPPSTSASAHFPVTITGTNGASVTVNHQPHRIVSLSATATEMLFAINAGAQVVAGTDPLDLALLDADRLVALAFDEELHEIGARPQRAFDNAVHEGLLEQGHHWEFISGT